MESNAEIDLSIIFVSKITVLKAGNGVRRNGKFLSKNCTKMVPNGPKLPNLCLGSKNSSNLVLKTRSKTSSTDW